MADLHASIVSCYEAVPALATPRQLAATAVCRYVVDAHLECMAATSNLTDLSAPRDNCLGLVVHADIPDKGSEVGNNVICFQSLLAK